MRLYKNKRKVLFYLLPGVLMTLIFVYYPLLQNFVYSLYRWSAFSQNKTFVGLAYYKRLAEDPVFYSALRNNMLYAMFSLVFQVSGGLILASILEEKFFRKYQWFFRTTFFLPSVISIAVVGLLWQMIYSPNVGIVNNLLKAIGLGKYAKDWLGSNQTAIYAVIWVSQWQYTGYIMLLFLVAIQKIPSELYEAAMIDGANWIYSFLHITIPQVKETILVASAITVIGAFKVFDEIYVMTGGGPGRSTEVLVTHMYRAAFRNDEMGYAAAIATVIFIITFGLTLLQFKISRTNNVE